MKHSAWRMSALLAATLATLCTSLTAQERYPNKPITIIVPVAAGGSIDPPMRIIADMAKDVLGVPVIIENHPGGGTVTGTARGVKSKPDGYTLVIAASGNLVTAPALQNVPYNVEKDFAYIAQLVTTPNSVVVVADSPFKTFKDVIDFARANPGKLRWAGSGIGTTSHMIGEATFRHEKVTTVALPTNGASEAMLAVLGKHVEVAVMGGWYPNYAAGKVRVLAETGPYKIPGLADVPLLKDLGYPVTLTTFIGLAAPAGTPAEAVRRWEQILPAIINSARFKEFLDKSKQTAAFLNAKEFGASVLSDYHVAVRLAKELNLQRK